MWADDVGTAYAALVAADVPLLCTQGAGLDRRQTAQVGIGFGMRNPFARCVTDLVVPLPATVQIGSRFSSRRHEM